MGDQIDDFGETGCAFSLDFFNDFHCHVRHPNASRSSRLASKKERKGQGRSLQMIVGYDELQVMKMLLIQ